MAVKAIYPWHPWQGVQGPEKHMGTAAQAWQGTEGLQASVGLGSRGAFQLLQWVHELLVTEPAAWSLSSTDHDSSCSAPVVGVGFPGQLSDIWVTIFFFCSPNLSFTPLFLCPFSQYNTFQPIVPPYIVLWVI